MVYPTTPQLEEAKSYENRTLDHSRMIPAKVEKLPDVNLVIPHDAQIDRAFPPRRQQKQNLSILVHDTMQRNSLSLPIVEVD